MKELLGRIQIQVNESLYTKNPVETDLGRRILKTSSIMISEMGFEDFTFKKLALELGTTESSVYRYFENKHNLLIYILSWYWGYMEYLMVFSYTNIKEPMEQLKVAVDVLCQPLMIPSSNDFIDQNSLNKIVIAEGSKTYLTKSVDKENKDGFFMAFKRPCHRLSEVISDINPDYPYPHSLASSVVEGIISQKYFDEHLTTLTDFEKDHEGLNDFYFNMVKNTIQH